VRVVVEKIDGVQSAKVSLKEGVATIRLAPSNRVTVAQIRDAIRSNGFTSRAAEIRVAGSLVQRGDTLMLVVPSTNEAFVLNVEPDGRGVLAELRRAGSNARVTVVGQLPGTPARKVGTPWQLQVRSVEVLR
jgi:copper chaperone CopZ